MKVNSSKPYVKNFKKAKIPKPGKVKPDKNARALKIQHAEKLLKQFENKQQNAAEQQEEESKFSKSNSSQGFTNQKRQFKKILNQEGLLVKHNEGDKWFKYQFDNKAAEDAPKLTNSEVEALLNEGREALVMDVAMFEQKSRREGGSEASWLFNVINKGTASDRKTAMLLQMTNSPVHSLQYVEKMLQGCKKQGTREVLDTLPILEDVFLNHFLPSNRKLVPFSNRALTELDTISSGNHRTRSKCLLLWAFEHEVKLLYQQFIQVLVEIVARPLEDVSKKAIRILANCLIERSEAEAAVLSALVNAFGHPNYKIGSNVVIVMEDVARKHPSMRGVIVGEIERLVFRKNVNDRAHLYSTTFLSQLKLRKEDDELACKLMSIYLSLFKTMIKKKVTDSRLLPIILAGANRAFPYATGVESLIDDVKDVYTLAHNASYRTAIPALKLLFQFHKLSDYVSDRFYGALYRKLLDPCPPGAYTQLLKLVHLTLKADPSITRVRTFVKRLLQICVNESSEFAASILQLISNLKKERNGETLIVLRKDADKTINVTGTADDDDEEEHYVDLDVDGKEIVKQEITEVKEEVEESEDKKKVQKGRLGASSMGGWVHRETQKIRVAKSPYDSDARNPLFVDATQIADNELLLLSQHFHPSVSVFAKALLEDGIINYGGDPLNDFTLMSFLDRFAFRNPKEIKKSEKSTRVMRKKAHDPWGVRKLAVDSKEYLSKKTDEIPADEKFLHRYASQIMKTAPAKNQKGAEDQDEWEYGSVNSEEFDAIMDRFEPGELNEEFDIDYGKEFSAEKQKKKKKKGEEEEDVDMDEDDDLDLDDVDDEDGGEGYDDDGDEDEDDEDNINESDLDDDDDMTAGGGISTNKKHDYDVSSEDDFDGGDDAEMAGDEFAAILEEMDDLDDHESKKGKKGGRKIKKVGRKSFKKGRK